MTENKLNQDEKQGELKKYRDLVLATIDYYLEKKEMHIKTADFDSVEHYQVLKKQTEEDFQKNKLTKLKQCFRDLTEMQVETVDLMFNKYLQDKTNYDIDIFQSYFQRVNKIIDKGKITTDNQFYDISMMIDQLCQTEPVDNEKIELLDRLLDEYKKRK